MNRPPVRLLVVLLACIAVLSCAYGDSRPKSVVVFWNRVLLQSVVDTRSGPTVTARALAVVHTGMFDAWSAYDPIARSVEEGAPARRPRSERTEANKSTAISVAAYRTLIDLFPSEASHLQAAAQERGIDTADLSIDPSTPVGIGNIAAAAILADRHHDGANQLGDLHPGAYSDYTGYEAVNTPDAIVNPDRWQPLRVPNGLGDFVIQKYVTPQWGGVKSFALGDPNRYFSDRSPATFESERREYIHQAKDLLALSAGLTDRQKISAEYWALGPGSVTPPGRWFEFAQFISHRDHHDLDEDVKLFFILGNTMLDSSIVCWGEKRLFDSERPITAIHYLFAGTPVLAWAGPYLGTQWIDGSQWQPYQQATVVTPAFPEFISGHSTFSAAGAEILTFWTRSERFGAKYKAAVGSSVIEPGLTPASPLKLEWKTFQAAADEAALSRRLGGIHFRDGDLGGRETGRRIADRVWNQAQYFIGESLESK